MRATVLLLLLAFLFQSLTSFAQTNDSSHSFRINDGHAAHKEMKKMLTDFSKSNMQKIVFSRGSNGCFHSYEDHVTYKSKNGKFVRGYREATMLSAMMLPDEMPDTISLQIVEEFVRNLQDIYIKKAGIDELGLTQDDYDSCKKNIRQFKAMLQTHESSAIRFTSPFFMSEYKPDFTRLLALVDSIKIIKQTTFNKYLLDSYRLNSTTVNDLNIKLVNKQNETLEISYEYCGELPFFFAWNVRLNGLKASCAAIEINRFLTGVFPDFLDNKGKVDFLQELVKFVYKGETQDN